MDEITKKLSWMLMILPGFLSLSLASFIVDFGEIDEFRFTFYSLALTFLDLSLTYGIIFAAGFAFSWRPERSAAIFASVLLAVSLIVGVGIGISAERDYLYRVLRSTPLTDSLTRRSNFRPLTFLLRQNTAGQLYVEGDARREGKVGEAWLRVHLDDAIFEGWPEFYGDAKSEIYLSPACRISAADMEEGAETISGPGVIIPEDEIQFAILLDRAASPCFEAWFGAREASRHDDVPVE